MGREGANVVGAVRQGGQRQVYHVEAVEKVFTEGATSDFGSEIAVRGRDDADVDRHRLGAAHPVDDALL